MVQVVNPALRSLDNRPSVLMNMRHAGPRHGWATGIRDRIRRLDQVLDSSRAIVKTEPEAASAVGKWIAKTNQERRRLEALLGRTPTATLTAEDIKALVAGLRARQAIGRERPSNTVPLRREPRDVVKPP
jgi:hypothetical protein